MSPGARRLLWALATVALAALTAVVVSRWSQETSHHSHSHSRGASEEDFHHWIHSQLAITPEQHEALEPIEAAFEKDRARIRQEIEQAGRDLAAAVRKGSAGSPEIDAALTRLNSAQAQLQRATLSHFFAMKDHLDPAQSEKLLQWTHDSILSH